MTEIRKLEPHDPVPERGRHVTVIRRFDEDDPHRVVLELVIARGRPPEENRLAVRADGTHMGVKEALNAARGLAEAEKLDRIYVIDRLAGARERESCAATATTRSTWASSTTSISRKASAAPTCATAIPDGGYAASRWRALMNGPSGLRASANRPSPMGPGMSV